MMWAQIINALLGVWLMASPAMFDYHGNGRTNDVIVGPIAVTLAIIAIWEVTRVVGRINVVIGIWLVIASWVLDYESVTATINVFIVGVMMTALAMTRAQARGDFAGGWRGLVKTEDN